MILHVKKLNHGQTEVRVGEGPSIVIATNAFRDACQDAGATPEAKEFGNDAVTRAIGVKAEYQGDDVQTIAAWMGVKHPVQ